MSDDSYESLLYLRAPSPPPLSPTTFDRHVYIDDATDEQFVRPGLRSRSSAGYTSRRVNESTIPILHYPDEARDHHSDEPFIRSYRQFAEPERYRRPENVFDADLRDTSSSSAFNPSTPSRQATQQRLEQLENVRARYHIDSVEWRNILGVHRYVDQNAREKAFIQSQTADLGKRIDCQFQWIHFQAKYLNLQDFLNSVAAIESLDLNERNLASCLLNKVATELQHAHATGIHATDFLERTVYRCDGNNNSETSEWAVFLSAPYLDFGKNNQALNASPSYHGPRTLFEFFYKDQDTSAQDAKQLFRTKLRSSGILHVYSMWILLLSSGTMVTSSPDAVTEILGPSVRIDDLTTRVENGELQLVRLVDPTDREIFISRTQCRTWFAIMSEVVDHCGRIFGNKLEIYQLNDMNGNEITAPEWDRFMTSQTDTVTTVKVSLRSTSPLGDLDPTGGDQLGFLNRHGDGNREDSTRPKGSLQRQERILRQNSRKRLRKAKLESEVADILQLDRPSLSIETPGNDVAHHEGPSDISLAPIDLSVGYIVYSPSESTGSSMDERSNVRLSRKSKSKRSSAHEDEQNITLRSLPTITPVRTSTCDNGREQSPGNVSWALVPYRGADETFSQPNTGSGRTSGHPQQPFRVPEATASSESSTSRALIEEYQVAKIMGHETSQKQRRETPTYTIHKIPNIITNTVHNSGSLDYIFYVPKDTFESKDPIEDSKRSLEPAENEEMKSKVPVSAEAQELPSDAHIRAKEDEGRSKVSEPAWKANGSKADQRQDQPPPVFLWPIDTAKRKRRNLATSDPGNVETGSGNVGNKETSNNDLPTGRLLHLILEEIDLNLTKGNRLNFHKVGGLSEKEAPIYSNLLESSKNTVLERLTSLNGASLPNSTGQVKSKSEIMPRVSLCFDILAELLEFFLPPDYPSAVVKKFWYAVDIWIRGLEQMMSSPPKNTKFRTGSYYVVNAELAPRSSQAPELKRPLREIDDCYRCLRHAAYSQPEDAIFHLRKQHFHHLAVRDEDLEKWVRRGDQLESFQLRCDANLLVETVIHHCASLNSIKNEITAGVCHNGKFESTIYSLPRALIKAFERTLMMTAYSGYAASLASKNYQTYTRRSRSFIEHGHVGHIVELGYAAERAFEEAKTNLMLMSRVNALSNNIQHDAVGLEYLLILLLADLKDRTTRRHEPNMVALYQGQLNQLTYETNYRPRRRLLKEIQGLEEEVRAVSHLMTQAWTILEAYDKKLKPKGFKTTTTTRKALYQDFEQPLFSKLLREYQEDMASYRRILQAIPRIRSLLIQSVDVQQEDHGKAILVFTTVTVIFLPMSFVTGFLGMNTRDVRDIEKSQWVFWVAALPLTCFVVALSTWIGYRGELLSLWLWKMKRRVLDAKIHQQNPSVVEYGRNRDIDTPSELPKLWHSVRKGADALHIPRPSNNEKQRMMNGQLAHDWQV